MEDSKRIFTEIIKRQMAILGPDITIAKVRNVPGIKIDEAGQVTNLEGDPQILLSELINQFVELSGLIIKKTMESILMSHPDGISIIGQIASAPQSSNPAPEVSSRSQETPPTLNVAPTLGQNVQNETDLPAGRQDDSIASANKDIEELNKMLNNIDKK